MDNQVNENIPSTPPHQSHSSIHLFNINQNLWVVAIVFLILLSSSIFWIIKNNKKGDPTSVPAPGITQALKKLTYQNKKMGFSFNYFSDWTIKESNLRWGSNFSKDNLLLTSVDADSELTTVSKNNYDLIIQAQNKFEKDTCSGIATTVWRYGYPRSFKNLKILGRDAYRTEIEKGAVPQELQNKEPYNLPIMFRRLQGEYPGLGSFEKYPNAITFCFEKKDKDKSLKLTMAYSSSQFTKENMVKNKIDKKILKEMDEMISAIKLD